MGRNPAVLRRNYRMKEIVIRLLRADEIECRVSVINERGLSLLLFKDARVDQKILDETFTPFGWKRSHQVIDGNLYCTVEVWDAEKGQWIGKQDVGTMSYSEKEKGQASDSFKRELKRTGVPLDTVLERYRLQSVGQMTPDIYGKAMKSLRNSKNRTVA